jgi:hypothetical protein
VPEPADEDFYVDGALRLRLPQGQESAVALFGLRWERPLSGRNALDRSAVAAPFNLSVGNESRTLIWPLSNRVKDPESGLQLSASRASGSLSGRSKNPSFSGRIQGVLFNDDVEIDGAVFRGFGMLIPKSGAVSGIRISLP